MVVVVVVAVVVVGGGVTMVLLWLLSLLSLLWFVWYSTVLDSFFCISLSAKFCEVEKPKNTLHPKRHLGTELQPL